MIKKLSAVVLCLSFVHIPFAAHAAAECDISAIDGIEVTVKKAECEKGINSEFEIKNNTGKNKDVLITVTAENEQNEVEAKATTVRRITKGKSVPFKFSSSRSENAKLYVSVTNIPGDNEIFVASNGNDSNNGTFSSPFKTLSRAVEAAKNKTGDVSIVLEGGRYNIDDTVVIDGVENLSSLTVTNDGRDVVLSGGVEVSGSDFTKVTNEGILSLFPANVKDKLYSLDLSSYGVKKSTDDPIYTELYYNGAEKQIAKYPNEGYSDTANITWLDYGNRILSFDSEDIKNWKDYSEAWVRGYFFFEWNLNSNPVSSIADGKITISPFTAGTYTEEARTDRPWYIYNLPSELDKENEYVIKGNVIYYYPPESEVASGDFEKARIQINTDKSNLIEINSDNVTLENLKFENSKGYLVKANADNVQILGCKFANSATTAASVEGSRNLVSACDFYNIGGSGINFSGGDRQTLTSSESVVENCYFEKVGRINRTGNGAINLGGCGTVARKNTITDTPHQAMSYAGNNIVIENNEFYNCLTDNAADAGIIYTGNNLSNLGTVIRGNYIHDSNSGLGAIYWDDFLSGQTAENNVFENVSNGVFIHGGVCNTFNGNIVKNTSYGARARGKGLYFKVGDETYNSWDLIAGRYSVYQNVFMAQLEGGNGYTAYPWNEGIWQASYKNVLKYVNNRTDNAALETTICNNAFVDVEIEGINTFASTEMSDVTATGNTTELTDALKTKYENVKKQSGIYADEYRKM